jgi:hypothetical protein
MNAQMHRVRLSVVMNVLTIALVIGASARNANALDPLTEWAGGATGNWTDSTWSNGVPGAGYRAFVNSATLTVNTTANTVKNLYLGRGGASWNGSTLVITTVGAAGMVVNSGGAVNFTGPAQYVGYGTGSVATITLNSGGTLTFGDGSQLQVGGFGGTGAVYQNGGTINNLDSLGGGVTGNAAFYIGAYGTGTYDLAGGTLNSPWTSVGYGGSYIAGLPNGTGTFVQTGGVHNTPLLTLGDGWDDGGQGGYNLSGTGVLNATEIDLGVMEEPRSGNGTRPLVGTFNQNGGTVTVTDLVKIGSDTVNYGGTGGRGSGTYHFNGGTLGQGTGVASLIVRYDAPAAGTFQGHGTVGFSGTLRNNGKVIADGGMLDLSSFANVTNTIANTSNNGWFATNGGALHLPAISVIGDGINVWGADMSLVHSTQLTFHGVVGSGNVEVDLLDAANSGAHNAGSLGAVMGLWDITPALTMSTFDATFRYDNALAGGNESSLKLFAYLGGQWTAIADTLNIGSHTISATGLSSGGYFAVAVPEPSSLAMAAAGLLALVGYGWRRQRKRA